VTEAEYEANFDFLLAGEVVRVMWVVLQCCLGLYSAYLGY
jgi:hypothetical protein